MQKITPFLWFDGQAEEAANFYVSIFENSSMGSVNRSGQGVMSVTFQLEGQEFIALNGGPHFKFTPAISFLVNCKTQEEVDSLWERLTAGGGEPGRCGWCKDKFGLSWQVIPNRLGELLKNPRVVEEMMKMGKIDLARLEAAGAGEG